MSVFGTCCAIGKIVTALEKESPIFLGIGPKGFVCCVFTNFAFGPLGYMITGCVLRKRVIKTYNVHDIKDPEGCPHKICYPCSYFQMLMSITEWDAERKKAEDVTVVGTAQNPINPYVPPN